MAEVIIVNNWIKKADTMTSACMVKTTWSWMVVVLAASCHGVIRDPVDGNVPNFPSSGGTSNSVMLDTKCGSVEGQVVMHQGSVTTRFLGLPYASPPIGDLRFREPVKHPGWALDGVWDGTRYQPSCPSENRSADTSEDCLYLNVYIPGNLSEVEHVNTRQIPVMVRLRGPAIPPNDTECRLAASGNVIVVSVMSRSGVLGYLSLHSPAALGNWGLLDQRVALMWVWDNIREFGGNPDAITLFGGQESAIDVGLHILSPLSRGFFLRAVEQGKSALAPHAIQTDLKGTVRRVAQRLQCPAHSSEMLMRCLRGIPLDGLLIAAREEVWGPVVDGYFLPDEPLRMMQAGRINPVDLILGVSMYRQMYHTNLDVREFEARVSEKLSQVYAHNMPQILAAVMFEYAFCMHDFNDVYSEFVHDMYIAAPVHLAGLLAAQTLQKRVYLYEYAGPGQEMEYVLGIIQGDMQQQTFSDAMMDAWSNFAWFGDPNPILADGGVTWQQLNASVRHYLRWDVHLDKGMAKKNYRAGRMAFWNEYLPFVSNRNTCTPSHDYCDKYTQAVTQQFIQTSTILWVLTVLCLILLAAVVLLCMKLFVPAHMWTSCYRLRRPVNLNLEQEQKKLHPLPYYDEPQTT